MIVPDVNLLVYAHDTRAPHHAAASSWWSSALSARQPVGLPWAVVFGFVRLVTHPRVMAAPLPPERAMDFVDAWFSRPNVRALEPGPRHLAVVRELFAGTCVGGSLTTDTHLAALALEHGATLCSNDRDFQRFPGLRLHNPVG